MYQYSWTFSQELLVNMCKNAAVNMCMTCLHSLCHSSVQHSTVYIYICTHLSFTTVKIVSIEVYLWMQLGLFQVMHFVPTPCCTPLSCRCWFHYFLKKIILAYLLLCKMCGHLSYPWVVISISGRSHYRLIELTISMKRIQKHSYHMLSPSKFHLKPADTGPVAKHANLLFIHAPAHYIQLADWYITSGEH